MEALEPLISSSVAGPIGIAHLPRLWLKLLLRAAGKLPEGYRCGDGGFDGGFLEKFGIDGPAFIAFVTQTRPDYLACERWVLANARTLNFTNVTEWNARVRGGQLPAERAEAWRARFGIADATFANAVALNDLDDWAGIHARLSDPLP
jgi:hypothetical protein